MTTEQLEAIRKRSDKASGNWIADYLKMKNAQVVLGDDVPALLAEVDKLNVEIADRETSHIDLYNENKRLQQELAYEKMRNETLESNLQHYRGYA